MDDDCLFSIDFCASTELAWEVFGCQVWLFGRKTSDGPRMLNGTQVQIIIILRIGNTCSIIVCAVSGCSNNNESGIA